jgi:hypothetical protein
VKDFLPHMNDCVEALGVSRIDKLHPPIARDYIAFNSQRDSTNIAVAGKIFDFTKVVTQ